MPRVHATSGPGAARRPPARLPPQPRRAPALVGRLAILAPARATSSGGPPGPGESERGPRPAGGVDTPSPQSPPALSTLPVIRLPRVLLPASRGAARLYEPRLVAALEAALERTDGRFVHAPSAGAGPPGRPAGPGGLPRVATLARATRTTSITRGGGGGSGGEVLVEYEGVGRVTVLDAGNAGTGPRLHAVATVAPLADAPPPDARAAAAAASLELDLAAALAAVDELTPREPGEGPGSRLPPGVAEHAPPPPPPTAAGRGGTVAAGLRASGHHAAARAVAAWSRQGGSGGGSEASSPPPPPADPLLAAAAAAAGRAPGGLASGPPPADPYSLAALRVGETAAASPSAQRRRELFSFAAADALALGPVEAAALCEVTDTAARLAFVLEAVRAHLADLAARAALRGAVEEGDGE